MAEELQSLLDRIQNEGVAKAEARAAEIVAEAEKKAAGIVAEAEKKAADLRSAAEADAATLQSRAEQSLQQAARDVRLQVGAAIQETLERVLRKDVAAALADPAFLQRYVELAAKSAGGAAELRVPEDQAAALADYARSRLADEIALLDEAGDAFDLEKVRSGDLTPMFFGSAVTNFGVEPFLYHFLRYTLPPTPRESDAGLIRPEDEGFSGFIFKIQANMNPAHRDRLAFLRVVSGVFRKGMTVWHSGTGKEIQVKQPQQFMADEREGVENAYPGDIIGLFDPGIYHLGDTLAEGRRFRFAKIPVFAPERFARVRPLDSMKRKQFQKGIMQLSEEGAIQTFRRTETGMEEMIVGVVGELQFDVLTYRLRSEYGVELVMDRLSWRFVRWIREKTAPLDELQLTSTSARGWDGAEREVLFFENEWSIRLAGEKNRGLELSEIAPEYAD